MAKAADWEESVWAVHIAQFLNGEVQVAYWVISDEQANSYPVVKVAILDWLGLTPEAYRHRFLVEPFPQGAHLQPLDVVCLPRDQVRGGSSGSGGP